MNTDLAETEEVELLQALINCGLIWHLQGYYRRRAQQLIDAGLCKDPAKMRG